MRKALTLLETYFGIKPAELKYAENYKRKYRKNEIVIQFKKSFSRTMDVKQALETTAKKLDLNVTQEDVAGHPIASWNYPVKYNGTHIVELVQTHSNTQPKQCDLVFPNYQGNKDLQNLQTEFLRNFDSNLEKILTANKS